MFYCVIYLTCTYVFFLGGGGCDVLVLLLVELFWLCVVTVNILCCWFCSFKERGGGMLVSGVEFVCVSNMGFLCINV
jgi:hypothetical protein